MHRRTFPGSDRARRRDPVAGRRQHAALLAYDQTDRMRRSETVPENRVYVSPDAGRRLRQQLPAFLATERSYRTTRGAPGVGNRPCRKTPIVASGSRSVFGKMTVLVTDGHLPYPYGRELTGL